MRKKPVVIFFDLLLLLVLGIIFLIVSTGGFSFSLGTFTITAYGLKNPTIGLIMILFLRKILLGKFFGEFLCLFPFRRRFVESPRFRKLVLIFPLFLILMMGLIAAINPLQHGLKASYYDNAVWAGSPLMTTRESALNLSHMQSEYPDIINMFSIQWKGVLFIPTSGEYEFITISDDGSELSIDNQLVVDNRGLHNLQKRTGRLHLEKGLHALEIRYVQGDDRAQFEVYWKLPGKQKPETISSKLLYLKKPTQTEFLTGRCLDIVFIMCNFLLLSSALIGVSSYRLLLAFLKASFIGKTYVKCCSWIIKEDVAKQVFPNPPKPTPERARGVFSFLFALAGYALLSLVWTYPLIVNFSTKMFGWGGDRYIYLWNMWWLKKALLNIHTNPLYTDYLFYPKGISLAFHDFSLLLTAISLPLQEIFSLEEIYNILFLLTFVLGGAGCFLLVRYLTGDNLAAFLSGIVFAFWGGRAHYTDHLYLASIQWLPYSALYLIKTLREKSYWNPLLAALFFTMNALTSWVYAVYMVLFGALFLFYFAWTERKIFLTAACMKRFGLIGVIFLILMSPVLYPMILDVFEGQQYMNAPVLPNLSASLNTVFFPSANHGIIGKYVSYLYLRAGFPVEMGLTGAVFIGYTVLFLCVYTGVKLKHLRPGFWVFSAIFFLLLSFGPHLQIFSKEYSWVPLPYWILQYLPILKTVRVPVRFMIMVMLCCSVLVGYACWDIFRRICYRKTLFFLLTVFVLFEFFRFYPIKSVEKTPNFYKKLRQDSEPYAILELTRLTELEHAARRSCLFQITHEKKLFNGFVARVSSASYYQAYRLHRIFDDLFVQPLEYLEQPDSSILKLDRNALLTILSYYHVRYVALYHDYRHGRFHENKRRLMQLFGQPLPEERGIYLFKVDSPPVSESVAFPGWGMFPIHIKPNGILLRQASKDSDIRVLNLDQHQTLRFRFQGQSAFAPEEFRIQIFVNNKLITTANIGDWVDVVTPPVPIHPGENIIRLRMPDVDEEDWWVSMFMRNIKIDLD
jgi:hypothetical protein